MNDLCADIGYKSINHYGEQLCGDHVEVVEVEDGSTIIVLSDGLGSGVKASILSTLTSKIISTMMAAGLPIEECVATIADTLPVCSLRGVAYSTFTIIRIVDNHTAEIFQYDNPHVVIIRNEKTDSRNRKSCLCVCNKHYNRNKEDNGADDKALLVLDCVGRSREIAHIYGTVADA